MTTTLVIFWAEKKADLCINILGPAPATILLENLTKKCALGSDKIKIKPFFNHKL